MNFIQSSQQTQQEIRDILAEAAEVAPFDPQAAGTMIADAQMKLRGLEEQATLLKLQLPKELVALRSDIDSASNTMFKKSTVQFEEFFLFSLISPDTTIAKAYPSTESVILLDKKHSRAHTISLNEKAVTTYKNPLLGEATSLTSSKGTIYALVPGKGVFSIPSTGDPSTTPVITAESGRSLLRSVLLMETSTCLIRWLRIYINTFL
ncbi:MAG: hypothetical protein UZ21_OP11001000827 [Microgenomates bacterium OLB22]|nr:MAG: hypothetical protein UZ21_OP11001000827 [Microgenomates bacterium OLB22]